MLTLFAAALFTSAFLLFWLEPLFAKMVLPTLGGSPGVWNTCLMFYQAALLLGYLYAHVGSRRLSPRRQAVLHVALLVVAGLALPIGIPEGWTPPAEGSPIPWLLGLLSVSVGLPFVLLAGTAPMLQRWFARVDPPAAADPYVLYGVSNLGSFAALLGFPFLLEPGLTLGDQARAWVAGYGLLWLATAGCAGLLRQRGAPGTDGTSAARPRDATSGPNAGEDGSAHGYGAERGSGKGGSVPWSDRLRWLLLAAVPSSLLLGVTAYLSTDVAAFPLLWVLPLALYLLTFVVVFSRPAWAPAGPTGDVHALLAAFLVILFFWGLDAEPWAFVLHLILFAVTALLLHGELARSRPDPRHLTEFYLWLAAGGALGGAFNALAAPLLFDRIVEYEAMVVIACLLRPSARRTASGAGSAGAPRWRSVLEAARRWAWALVPGLVLGCAVVYDLVGSYSVGSFALWAFTGIAVLGSFALRKDAGRFGLALATVFAVEALVFAPPGTLLERGRSFFGAYRVVAEPDGPFHLLYHGTTVHGAQFAAGEDRGMPLTYYHPRGPAGDVFRELGDRWEGRRIGVVGLGAGSLLCYGRPGQRWTFYEIDPEIARIARDTRYFTYLSDCPVGADVVLGDARLSLERAAGARLSREGERREEALPDGVREEGEAAGPFDLLVLDAFSSASVPVHLLTREALEVYLRALDEGGVLLLHISNTHLDLEPVVGALARDAGLAARIRKYVPSDPIEARELAYASDWVVMARRREDLGPLSGAFEWDPLSVPAAEEPWTDDYSDVAGALAW